LFILSLIIIVFFADSGMMPSFIQNLYAFPAGDKAGHFILMGTLALLLNLCLSKRTISIFSRPWLLGSMIVLGVVTLEEITQIFFLTRSFDIVDLCFDYLGIFLLGSLPLILIKNRAGLKR